MRTDTGAFGNPSMVSPECTDPAVPPSSFAPYGPYEVRSTNKLAVFAFLLTIFNLVVGTLSMILFPLFTLAMCVLGIVLGHLALRSVRRSHQAGRSLAIAALVLSYAGLLFELVVLGSIHLFMDLDLLALLG
ncbi:DUF4190 domain-containing protein [Dietzia timorensis]|uniref:DUF4190 domain-containing protein n=1 Tax=Dietzia timorensis TaxID=499555 RepID=UPI0008346D83|nr:DUF4190 domain-containing protein [Dietzia timorensis]